MPECKNPLATVIRLATSINSDLNSGNIPVLTGGPGSGKAAWAEAFAEAEDTKCFSLSCRNLLNAKPKNIIREPVIQKACAYASEHPWEAPVLLLDGLDELTDSGLFEQLLHDAVSETPTNLRVMASACSCQGILEMNSGMAVQCVTHLVENEPARQS